MLNNHNSIAANLFNSNIRQVNICGNINCYNSFSDMYAEAKRLEKDIVTTKVHCVDANKGAQINSIVATRLTRKIVGLNDLIDEVTLALSINSIDLTRAELLDALNKAKSIIVEKRTEIIRKQNE